MEVMVAALLILCLCVLAFCGFACKFNLIRIWIKKVDRTSKRHGGELVAQVLQAHGVKYVFTLVGGHISPILVACEQLKIKVVDVRHEVTAVFAADAVARLSGTVGVAAVTAGPGLTNTVTAVKNAQMAESPLLLIGGAAASLLKGRGALQDIDQISLFKPLCKFTASVTRVSDIVPTLKRAFQAAQSGTPGPVFVEFPVDTLYPYSTVIKEAGGREKPKSLSGKIANWYVQTCIDGVFAGAWDLVSTKPLPPKIPLPSDDQVSKVWRILKESKRPVCLVGSQATLPPVSAADLRSAFERLGVPCFLGGMSRGLLGRAGRLHIRQQRKEALKEADVVLLIGTVCDFRLGYGKILSRQSKVVAVNRNRDQLFKNSDIFWKPNLAIEADSATLVCELSKKRVVSGNGGLWEQWIETLQLRDVEKESENMKKCIAVANDSINPVKLLHVLEDVMAENSIIVADGGDFVGTAAYILRPRAPLSWLDPGAFGTLGVGGGFALGAKLVRPDAEVWIIWGDGSSAYSLAEYDTFFRFKIPVISLIGNDACWSQIAREQVPMFGSGVACNLVHTSYDVVAKGYGGEGVLLRDNDETAVRSVLEAAQMSARNGKAVVINAIIAKSDFREGSLSV